MKYTNPEIIEQLQALARQSEDAARACEAETSVFKEEYNALLEQPQSTVTNNRIGEIYTYIVDRPRDARRLRREAELFRIVISKLETIT